MSTTAAPQQEIDAVIEAYGGDARIAVRELLADADFLRRQIVLADCAMSRGFTRGWRPILERDGEDA